MVDETDLGVKVPTEHAFDLLNVPTIHGKYVTLAPFDLASAQNWHKHLDLPNNPQLWKWVAGEEPASGEDFWKFISQFIDRKDWAVFAVKADPQHLNPRRGSDDNSTSTSSTPQTRTETLGILGYLDISRENRVVETGFVIFAPALQRTVASTEAHYLLLRNACEPRAADDASSRSSSGDVLLPYRRVGWGTNSRNTASRRAAQRLGYVYEGRIRNLMVVRGHSRDSDYFSIIEAEWPAVRAALEAWLEDANFDAEGRQLRSLEEIRRSLTA